MYVCGCVTSFVIPCLVQSLSIKNTLGTALNVLELKVLGCGLLRSAVEKGGEHKPFQVLITYCGT